MKKYLRLLATTLVIASVFLAGAAMPQQTSKADPTTTPQDCPAGYHSVINVSSTQPTTYDCAPDDNTPQTAPANQPTPSAAPVTSSTTAPTTSTPSAPNCH